MQEIVKMITKVAPTPTTVISGESGVGKEVVARTIHASSLAKDNVFLPVNCSAIPDNLLESQLFGHVKGSFTGAVNSQEGLFQRARGGTIFLDEIGEMPMSLQPKLLRVLEEKPAGGFDQSGEGQCAHPGGVQPRSQSRSEGALSQDPHYRLAFLKSLSRRCASAWKICRHWSSIDSPP
jgi:transcriptional regulator of aromatic amino acid metabolism